MASEISLTRTHASHPFDGSEVTNIILRTSDDVDFHIHTAILSIASPFFKSMFSLPQNGASDSVVGVAEDSTTLDPLLRLCYPISDPDISDLTLLVKVLEAAMKYEVIVATAILTNKLHAFIQDNSREVFTLSCRLSLEEIASVAATRWRSIIAQRSSNYAAGTIAKGRICDWRNTIVGRTYIDEMANISAGALYRLTQFVRPSKAVSPFCYKAPSVSPESHQVHLPNSPTQLLLLKLLKRD